MAAVSDSMYKPHSPAIYVSSNAYYGYIPPCSATQNKFEYVVGFRELTNRGCEMEIDEDCSSRLNSRNEPNHRFLEQHQQATSQINVLQHRNRKRCSADQTSYSQQKKFREGSTKDLGLAKVYNETPRLLLNNNNSDIQEQSLITSVNCCRAASKHNLISNPSSNTDQSNAIYEKMLFETHGCNIYHLHIQQQVGTDTFETEF